MKFTLVTLVALAASAIGNPVATPRTVATRQLEQQSSVLSSLFQTVKAHTGVINQTLSGYPAKPDNVTAAAAALALKPHLQALTDALLAANKTINTPHGKLMLTIRQGTNTTCDAKCITAEVTAIVNEIASTLKGIITQLGLGPVLGYLQPLLVGLGGLVLSLDVLVTGLLLLVTAIVSALLGGLGLALTGLGFPAANPA